MPRRSRCWALLFTACWALLPIGCTPPASPNVLLVVVDTLRADHSSAYGYARDTTPRLRALAAEGVRFELAYAPMGLTGPSHATLFTGLPPLRHGVVSNALPLPPGVPTLAEGLAARGYQTAAVVSSFVLDRRFGLHRGFDHYDDALDPAEATIAAKEWRGHDVVEGFDRRADHTARRAIEWLRQARDPERPFLLFVHLFDPHSPYEPPPPWDERFAPPAGASALERLVALYDGEIAFTDAALGGILDALAEVGAAADTLVVVTADHGEGLMQRGYMLHGLSVYEEEVRVPLVFRLPAGSGGAPGRAIAAPVAAVDLLPTVADLVGIELPGAELAGRSLAGALRGDDGLEPERRIVVQRRRFRPALVPPVLLERFDDGRPVPPVSVEGEQFALREGRLKVVSAPDEGLLALYDLEADPGETRDLAASPPADTARLLAALDARIAAERSERPPVPSAPAEEDRERLRALGYTD